MSLQGSQVSWGPGSLSFSLHTIQHYGPYLPVGVGCPIQPLSFKKQTSLLAHIHPQTQRDTCQASHEFFHVFLPAGRNKKELWLKELSKNLVRERIHCAPSVALLIITSDFLGALLTCFRGRNARIWEVLFRKIYNSDSEEGPLWTPQPTLHLSSLPTYLRIKVGVFQPI